MFLCLVQLVGLVGRPQGVSGNACNENATQLGRKFAAPCIRIASPCSTRVLLGTYVVAIIWLGWFGCDSDAPMLGLPFRIGFDLFDVLVCL